MRTYCGRPGRDGVRNSASELEGCLGVKLGNPRCSMGCVGIVLIVGVIAAIVILILKFKYHLF